MWQAFRVKQFAIKLLTLILTVCFVVCWNAGCSYFIWKCLNNWVFLSSFVVVPLWYKILAECKFFKYRPIYIVLLSHFTTHATAATTTTTTEISSFFCRPLLQILLPALIFIRLWIGIPWRLSYGFSLTFSYNLPVCNTAYDSYPGCLVTIVSVLFARYALRQKKQLNVECAWLGYHVCSVRGTCGGRRNS